MNTITDFNAYAKSYEILASYQMEYKPSKTRLKKCNSGLHEWMDLGKTKEISPNISKHILECIHCKKTI